jgi:hypothetical protein
MISAAEVAEEGEHKVRLLKMFGLAALAAVMAMAFVGGSSAMAENTQLCKVDQTPCAAGNVITHVHEVTSAKAKLLSVITVECDVLFLGDVSGATLANPLIIGGNFTYTNCGSCEVKETSAKSTIKVLKTATELAEVTGAGTVFVDCGPILECEYKGEGLKGHGLGALSAPPNGTVSILNQVTKKTGGGFFCPAESKLDITTSSLTPTYIRS